MGMYWGISWCLMVFVMGIYIMMCDGVSMVFSEDLMVFHEDLRMIDLLVEVNSLQHRKWPFWNSWFTHEKHGDFPQLWTSVPGDRYNPVVSMGWYLITLICRDLDHLSSWNLLRKRPRFKPLYWSTNHFGNLGHLSGEITDNSLTEIKAIWGWFPPFINDSQSGRIYPDHPRSML